MDSTKIYISIVVAVRNDNHGGNFLIRFQIFLNTIFHLNTKYPLNIEIVIVEWNTPNYKPSIITNLNLTQKPGTCKIKLISVTPEIHNSYKNSQTLNIYQMIAKNVGIRRAEGDFILCTNADIIFSEELFKFFQEMNLNKGKIYRAVRFDIKNPECIFENYEDLIKFARDNIIRINKKITCSNESKKIYDLFYENIKAYNFINDSAELLNKRPFTNASGDFQMMHKEDWILLRGYPEIDKYSFHIDSILEYQAVLSGLEEVILPDDLCIYHIEHSSGYTPEAEKSGDFQKIVPDYMKLTNFETLSFAEQLSIYHDKIKILNHEWGLPDSNINIIENFEKERDIKVTFLSIPKPFNGQFETIQYNAINSWIKLSLNPEIILFCNEEFKEYKFDGNVRYIHKLEYTKYNKPDLSSLFSIAKGIVSTDYVVYINCDIILLDDFSKVLKKVLNEINDDFVIVGRRLDAKIDSKIDFQNHNWWDNVAKLKDIFPIHSVEGIDYFVFPKKFLNTNIPNFSIGACVWDQWLLYKFLSCGYILIDSSSEISAIHQEHSYEGNIIFEELLSSDIPNHNLELANGRSFMRNISDCHVLIKDSSFYDQDGQKVDLKKLKLTIDEFLYDPLNKIDTVYLYNNILINSLTTSFNKYYFDGKIDEALKLAIKLYNNPDMLLNAVIISIRSCRNYNMILDYSEKIREKNYLKGYNLLGIKYYGNSEKHIKFWNSTKADSIFYPKEIILGLIYFFGWGVERDLQKGIELIMEQTINKKEFIRLFCKLYFEYFKKLDSKIIIDRIKDLNIPEFLYFLGVLYTYELGVEKDIDMAIHYFDKAAQLGLTAGYNLLAINKILNFNDITDYESIKKLMKKGVNYNDIYSIENLKILEDKLIK